MKRTKILLRKEKNKKSQHTTLRICQCPPNVGHCICAARCVQLSNMKMKYYITLVLFCLIMSNCGEKNISHKKPTTESICELIGKGNFREAKKLINNNSDELLILLDDTDCNTMYNAIVNNDLRTIIFLDSIAANPDTISRHRKERALRNACSMGRYQIVKYFMNNDTSLKLGVNVYSTPLHLAVSSNKEKWIRAEQIEKDRTDYYSTAKLLIKKGYDVNAKDNQGNTPLHKAAFVGHGKNVELLIQNGATIDALNNRGETPLFKAFSSMNEVEIGKKLVKMGADINIKNTRGESIGHRVARSGNIKIMELLFNNGLERGAVDSSGNTYLHHAVYGKKEEMVRFLISKGEKTNIKNKQGITPVFSCVSGNNEDIEITQILIDNGAKVTIKDNNGNTPLHYAVKYTYDGEGSVFGGDRAIIETIIHNGGNIYLKNKKGESPLEVANYKIKEMLVNLQSNKK